MQVFDFFIPSHLKFGVDSLNRVGTVVSSVGSRVFLVTETALMNGETISHIQNLLTGRRCEVILYNIDTKPFAASAVIDKGAVLARASYCDVVVGVGGLRILSAAKAIAMLVNNTRSVNDYIDSELIKEQSIPLQSLAVYKNMYSVSYRSETKVTIPRSFQDLSIKPVSSRTSRSRHSSGLSSSQNFPPIPIHFPALR